MNAKAGAFAYAQSVQNTGWKPMLPCSSGFAEEFWKVVLGYSKVEGL
jgi:hypothetical protein